MLNIYSKCKEKAKISNKTFFSKASDGDMTKIFNDGDFTLQYE